MSDTETEFLDRAALRICETASGVIFEAAKTPTDWRFIWHRFPD